jgi:hypothetical protein
MRVVKEGGIGGFEIQPVYPVETKRSEMGLRQSSGSLIFRIFRMAKIVALQFTAEKARELRMDVTLGSGWPFGGPSLVLAC